MHVMEGASWNTASLTVRTNPGTCEDFRRRVTADVDETPTLCDIWNRSRPGIVFDTSDNTNVASGDPSPSSYSPSTSAFLSQPSPCLLSAMVTACMWSLIVDRLNWGKRLILCITKWLQMAWKSSREQVLRTNLHSEVYGSGAAAVLLRTIWSHLLKKWNN